jgi:predicted transcriptional regulator
MSSEVLTIRVNSKLKSRLDQLGKILHRSKSYIAEQAISQYVDENAWQIAELTQAEEEIRQGKFVAGNEVNQYLDSWETPNKQKTPKV